MLLAPSPAVKLLNLPTEIMCNIFAKLDVRSQHNIILVCRRLFPLKTLGAWQVHELSLHHIAERMHKQGLSEQAMALELSAGCRWLAATVKSGVLLHDGLCHNESQFCQSCRKADSLLKVVLPALLAQARAAGASLPIHLSSKGPRHEILKILQEDRLMAELARHVVQLELQLVDRIMTGQAWETVCSFSQLRHLTIASIDAGIHAAPACIGRLTSLEFLEVHLDGWVEQPLISPAVASLPRLQHLIISSAAGNTLVNISGNTSLQQLELYNIGLDGHNSHVVVPAALQLPGLRRLSLEKVGLTGNVAGLGQLKQLKTLECRDIYFDDHDADASPAFSCMLASLTGLTELVLSTVNTEAYLMPGWRASELQALSRLEVLCLRGQGLQQFVVHSSWGGLRDLNLSYNLLRQLPDVSGLPALRSLDVSNQHPDLQLSEELPVQSMPASLRKIWLQRPSSQSAGASARAWSADSVFFILIAIEQLRRQGRRIDISF